MQKRELLKLPLMKVTRQMLEAAESDYGFEMDRHYYYLEDEKFWVPNYFWFYRIKKTEEVLEIAIFTRGDIIKGDDIPRYRVFLQSCGKYITYDMATEKWRQSSIEKLEYTKNYHDSPGGLWSHVGLWMSKRDKKELAEFIKGEGDEPRAAVNLWQLKNKHGSEINRVNSEMELVPAIPKNFENWMLKKGMPQYIFYDAGKKVEKGHCTHCKNEVNIESPKYGVAGVCKSCKSAITFISRKKGGRRIDERRCGLLQKTPKGYVYRQFMARCWYEKGELVDGGFKEEIRIMYDKDFLKSRTYMHYRFKATRIIRWQKYQFRQGGPAEYAVKLYSRNLKRVLKDSPLKYSSLELFAKHYQGNFFVDDYIKAAMGRDWIEKLVKCKFYNLAATEISNGGWVGVDDMAAGLKKYLGLGANYYRMLAGTDPTREELGVARIAERRGMRLARSDIEYLSQYDRMDFMEYFESSTPHKFLRYLREVIKDSRSKITEYRDYLSMVRQLDYDMGNPFILFPKNVKERHDLAVEDYNERERLKQKKYENDKENLYQENREKLKHLEMKNKTLMVVLPKRLEEIREEGHVLKHCVSSYSERVAKGETIIMFVRRTDAKGKPFYTMEVKDGKVSQCRGKNNRDMTEEVKAFVKKFEKKKLKTLERRAG